MKLIALATVAMLAIGAGGAVAMTPASPDDVQFQNDALPSGLADGVDDSDADEKPDQKFDADDLERTNLSDEDVEVNVVESGDESDEGNSASDSGEEPDQKFTAEELEQTNLSNEDIEVNFVESND